MDTTPNAVAAQPYLFFEGRCEEALHFYRSAIGAETIMVMRFRESPDRQSAPPGCDDKVLHAQFRVGNTTVMASDGHCTGKAAFQGFAMTLSAAGESEADRFFAGLAEGGKVQMPLAETFFSPRFGMVTDRFGVLWMIIVPRPAE